MADFARDIAVRPQHWNRVFTGSYQGIISLFSRLEQAIRQRHNRVRGLEYELAESGDHPDGLPSIQTQRGENPSMARCSAQSRGNRRRDSFFTVRSAG
jgi:hypothetical protein